MKLRYSQTSPYVRKVLVVALEAGLEGRIERVPTNVQDPKTDLPDDNPLGKVPTLITDAGEALYDSPVICEYLDSLHDGAKLFPAPGPARWQALRLQALADGILDAALLRMIEEVRRPEELRWAGWSKRQASKIDRGLDRLEQDAGQLAGDLTIGGIAVAAALGYLDFRFGTDDWRSSRPALAAWGDAILQRPSFVATAPQVPA